MDIAKLFLRLSHPWFLLGAAILYALGAGIAHYLGVGVDWNVYWLGQFWVSVLQLSAHFLYAYYHGSLETSDVEPETAMRIRRSILLFALTCLAILASLTVFLIVQVRPPAEAYLFMALAFLGAFFYAAPAVKLEESGYGELIVSALAAFLLPVFAHLLQAGELHRVAAMAAFPLTALHLAMLLAFELPDYATQVKYNHRTLMVRMGWQNGMILHNLLILSAFLLLALAAVFGFPWFATWPALLTLPVGLYQIWQMRAIANGARPNWNALMIGALALFAITVYLMTFAFWMN